MSNSPRYVGFTSPPYAVTFIDDSGRRIDLTGANTSLFTWTLQNLTASTSHVGGGAWVITDAVNGEAEYYLTTGDVAVAGNCLVFVSIQLPSDGSPREFDPDPLMIEVGAGTTSPAPIPIVQVSGYIAPTYLVDSAGTNKASVSSSGAVKVDGSGVIQPVSGNITANAGTNLNTSALALESGGNLATIKNNTNTLVTNTTGLATQTTLASAKTDLDTIVTQTSNVAKESGGHLATIDTNISASKTDLDTINTNTSNTSTNTSNINTHAANIDTAIGTTSDAVWSGSGSGSEIAILKKIATAQSGTVNVAQVGGTSVSAIALGQAVKNSSLSVVLASDTQDIPVRGDFVTLTNLSAGSLNADLLPSTDVSQYRYMTLHIIGGTWSGTIQFQKSLDNANFQIFELTSPIPTSTTYGFQTAVNGWFEGPINALYCRIRMTSYTSGTALGIVTFFTTPPSPNNTFAYCMQSVPASSLTPWYFIGPSSNAVQAAGGSGTVIKGSAGHLWSAVVTATGTAELDIYDNASSASGKILLPIPANAPVGTIYSFSGGAFAANGIYSNGVANCPAVTFFYGS